MDAWHVFRTADSARGVLGTAADAPSPSKAFYRAHLVRSSYQAMEEQSNNAKESLSRAVKHAQAARLDWAAIELAELKKKGAFKGVDADAWKGIMKQLRKGAKG